jgi:hypothetical protein
MAKRNYIEELRALSVKENDGLYGRLADYMNARLIKTNQTIFEYIPGLDGLKEGYQDLYPVIEKLREKGFFDGN